MLKNTFLILMGFLVWDCESEDLPSAEKVETYKIEALDVEGKTITFAVKSTGTSSCWGYSHFEHSISDSIVFIDVYGQVTTNDPCLAVLITIDATLSVTVPSTGEFTFKFWQHNESTLDTTLVIG